MCLYPKFIKNRKYLPNKKNNNNPPVCNDRRLLYVPIGCGYCKQCREQKAREWQVRLTEEVKRNNERVYFVTLSFAPKELEELTKQMQIKYNLKKITEIETNAAATYAVRRFLERYRKKYKVSCKHWLITELGDSYTERIHLHGLIWTEKIEELENIWKYGNIYIGKFVNDITIKYITKYITKVDEKHKSFVGKILTSAGIGRNYIKSFDAEQNKYRPLQTKEYYKLPNGQSINLPIYYRNKIYSEEEREKLWIEKLDQKVIYINGVKHTIRNEKEIRKVENIRRKAQEINERLGYGNDKTKWNAEEYNITLRMLNRDNNVRN